MSGTKYDQIGREYARRRRPDPRWAAAVHDALGDAGSVVNVGAGAGSYEPATTVVAIEPSAAMIAQRRPGSAPCLQASAEAIPLPDAHADAAMAILTVHHWADPAAGLAELRRIARRRVVIVHWDDSLGDDFWLMREYIPENAAWDRERFPSLRSIVAALGEDAVEVRPLPVPHDCVDGFLGAYWRRPAAYLDPAVRAAISNLADPTAPPVDEGLARLAGDLVSGAWHERHADLLGLEELDLGYRLLVAELRAGG
jgi:SAM-dependent methyltransferase